MSNKLFFVPIWNQRKIKSPFSNSKLIEKKVHIRFAHKVFTVPQIIRKTKTNRNKIKHRWICVKKPVARCLKKHYFDLSNRQCFTFLYLIDTFLTESTPNQLLYLIFFTLKNKMPTTLWKNKIVVNKMKINFQEMSFAYSLFSWTLKETFIIFPIFWQDVLIRKC